MMVCNMINRELDNSLGTSDLKKIAHSIRYNVIKMVAQNGQGYVQQGLGAADLFTYLYFAEALLDPRNPSWEERDRIFLSTAHNSAVFHATLAERGFFPKSQLKTYTKDNSELEINVSERLGPVVEATCGSLGQGLSVATGVAQSAARKNQSYRVYVILGDGELQEGQIWEAAMYAGSQALGNLCLIIDRNYLQVEGHTSSVIQMEPIEKKLEAFGWQCQRINGHDFQSMELAFIEARAFLQQPSCIIAETIVGKGVPSLENQMSHNMIFPQHLAEKSLKELELMR